MQEQDAAAAWDVLLAGALEAPQGDALRESWLESAWPGRSVRVDLSGVESIHTVILQLLLALRTHVERTGGAYRVTAASAVAREAARSLGLAGALGLEAGAT